jgi:hypothetical protein
MPVEPHRLAELFQLIFADKNELRAFLRGWPPVGTDVLDHLVDGPFATFRLDVADALRARGALKAALAITLRDALVAARPHLADAVRAVFGDAPAPAPAAPAPAAGARGDRPDVFIAHASADKARATELYNALLLLGLKPIMDDKQLRDGFWDLELPKMLEAARLVVVLHSPLTWAKAVWLRDEATRAVTLHHADESAHMLRIVHLDGVPANKPFGYANVNHLLWQPGGAAQVAAELALDLGQPAPVVP